MPFQLINQCSWEPVKTWVNVSLNEWQRWTDRQVSYLNSGYAAGSFITYFSRPIHSAHVDVLGVLPVPFRSLLLCQLVPWRKHKRSQLFPRE